MFPDQIKTLILRSFTPPSKPYGQLVTQGKNQSPEIRTVHFQYLENLNTFAISTHVESRKWAHIQENPILTGCFWDEPNQTQLTWKANAELVENQSTQHQELLESLWSRMREEVRLTYLMYANKDSLTQSTPPQLNLNQRSSHHVAIIFKPFEWDVYEFSPKGFRFGNRRIYTTSGERWNEQKVCILNSR